MRQNQYFDIKGIEANIEFTFLVRTSPFNGSVALIIFFSFGFYPLKLFKFGRCDRTKSQHYVNLKTYGKIQNTFRSHLH